ncbi:NADAR family protein [Kumtagia ephedrae]|nr:NADAR family protein [Mesorhizobium ephedrae]
MSAMKFSRQRLEREIGAGASPRFLFFWGHQPSKDGKPNASCFSQWWPAQFEVDGVRYPTAEHWMMAGKARLFGDAETTARIIAADSPKEAKQFGRLVRGFDERRWDEEKLGIVVEGSVHKFGQNEPLKDFLLSTGDVVLVEASPVDRVWGIGLAVDDEGALDPRQWRGDNLLGFALMEARDRLRSDADYRAIAH